MAAVKKGGKAKLASRSYQTKPFRMDWPYLLEEGTDPETGEPNGYRVTALCPPDFPIAEMEDLIYEVYEEQFGKDEEDWPSGRNDRRPEDVIRDCKEKKGKPGYVPGWKFFSMSSRNAPGVIDANKDEVMSKREVYGGRWARATVNISAYDTKSKGVTIYLNNIQLLDHDEALSGRPNAKDEFDEYQLKDRSGGKRRARDEDDDGDTRDRGSRSARGRGRDDDEDDDRRDSRRSGARDRGRDDEDDRGSRTRGHTGDEDERGGRGSRDRDEGRRRSRDEDDEPKRGRSRDDDDDRSSRRRSRDDDDAGDDDRSSRRGSGGRDRDDDRPASRSRSRDDDDDRGNSRDRRGSRRDDDDDDRPSRSGRGGARKDDDWN